jgi:hypothetical protein
MGRQSIPLWFFLFDGFLSFCNVIHMVLAIKNTVVQVVEVKLL